MRGKPAPIVAKVLDGAAPMAHLPERPPILLASLEDGCGALPVGQRLGLLQQDPGHRRAWQVHAQKLVLHQELLPSSAVPPHPRTRRKDTRVAHGDVDRRPVSALRVEDRSPMRGRHQLCSCNAQDSLADLASTGCIPHILFGEAPACCHLLQKSAGIRGGNVGARRHGKRWRRREKRLWRRCYSSPTLPRDSYKQQRHHIDTNVAHQSAERNTIAAHKGDNRLKTEAYTSHSTDQMQ